MVEVPAEGHQSRLELHCCFSGCGRIRNAALDVPLKILASFFELLDIHVNGVI